LAGRNGQDGVSIAKELETARLDAAAQPAAGRTTASGAKEKCLSLSVSEERKRV